MKVTAATIAALATTLATAWADDATSSSTTSAAAIPTSSNAATMVSLTANLTSTQRDCFEKNDCDANSDKCLECLGVSQNTVNTAADCMRQCPDPKAGATVSDYANCAAKCYQSLYDEIKTNATDNSLSSSSSAAVKSATDSSKSSSTSDDEDDEENDGSGANAMVISSLLVVAPLALAALMANL
ncbi:hypothetical protein H4R34_004429 [Dimargaris verticillata]|uniref:Extracellular membrane protein CFEM domain-containing protein n=1 Tax=Dimargaris verticillata TaxID=2761393 RepID=A0A9W8EB55_9FUNG|nr:hypothetical protein H4R34_004429 [Dimargaris verticillata]